MLSQGDVSMQECLQMAMLKLLSSLPAVISDKSISVHPNRRLAVTEALAASPNIARWITTAYTFAQQHPSVQARQLYLGLGLAILGGWCEMGSLPFEPSTLAATMPGVVQQVCQAVYTTHPASASETLVSMLQVCKDSEVLPVLVDQWQASMTAARAQQTAALPKEVEQGVCQVLCAAGSALLAPALLAPAPSRLQSQFATVAEQLLERLTSTDDDVALTALEFWQDVYVTTLAGLPADARKAAMASHQVLLQHLCSSLVLRARLDPEVASTSTADARDLPEHIRLVRRELASALRDISCLVGIGAMTSFMASLVRSAFTAYTSGQGADGSEPGHPRWTHLECALYAANVVLGQSAPGPGRPGDVVDDNAVMALIEMASACTSLSGDAGNPKLAGTALTLLGGLSGFYAAHPEALNAVLPALSATLQARDTKLSRNGATTVYRLCQHKSLSSALLTVQRPWVESLLQLYQAMGGVQRRIGHGDDLPTEELLLASLCHLATVPSAPCSDAGGSRSELLVHLAAPKLTELQQALAGLVCCAPTALQMLMHTKMLEQDLGTSPAASAEALHAASLSMASSACLEILQMVVECAGHTRPPAKPSPRSTASSSAPSPAVFAVPSGSGSVSMSRATSATSPLHQQEAETEKQQQEAAAGLVTLVAQCVNSHIARMNGIPDTVLASAASFHTSSLQRLPLCGPSILPGAVEMLAQLQPDQLVAPHTLTLLAVCMSVYAPESSGQPPAQLDQLGEVLQRVAYTSLVSGCAACGAGDDPDYVVPLLRMCSGVILSLPVLTQAMPNTLDMLLGMTLKTSCSYSQEQCKAWLHWAVLLCSAPFKPPPSQAPSEPLTSYIASRVDQLMMDSGHGAQHTHHPAMMLGPNQPQMVQAVSQPALMRLAVWLEGGAGAQVVLAMLLAASGGMPPDLILPVATALHHVWAAVGTQRFSKWLEAAVLVLAPEHAPWFKQRQEAKQAAVKELLSKDMEDLSRFKKNIKAFCGGKKKNGSVLNSRDISRSSSCRSSVVM